MLPTFLHPLANPQPFKLNLTLMNPKLFGEAKQFYSYTLTGRGADHYSIFLPNQEVGGLLVHCKNGASVPTNED